MSSRKIPIEKMGRRLIPAPAAVLMLAIAASCGRAPTALPAPTAPATHTPPPTAPSTRAPIATPTASPPPPTAEQAGADIDVGVHGWAFILETMVAHPQDNALISVPMPNEMRQQGYDWPNLVAAAGYAGPTQSQFKHLERAAASNAGKGANAIVYVPEGTRTAGNVPISETIYLTDYLDSLVSVAAKYGYTVGYGPSLELLSDPGTWRYGKHYDLRTAMVTSLASRLPDDSFWILRMFTPEMMYGPTDGYRGAVAEIVSAIHAGNPTIRIVLLVSCPAGEVDEFLGFVDVSRGLIDQAYAGIDPARDQPGVIQTMIEIIERTERQAGTPLRTPAAVPPTRPAPAGGTRTPASPPPASTTLTDTLVLHDLAYGPDPRHVLDLYLPQDAPVPLPVVAWFHGGGLADGDKKMVRNQAAVLADAGFAVVAANYRLRSTEPAYYLPAQVHDAKAVIRWIRGNAATYGLDPTRIGSIGGSAGAFLSTTLGTSGDVVEVEGDIGPYLGYSSRVQCSVGLAGQYDWLRYYAKAIAACKDRPVGDPRCQEHLMFMCGLNEPACLDRLRQSSAISSVSADDGPSLVAIGDQDETPGGIEDHTAYDAALDAAGVDSTLIIMPGKQHGELWPDIAPILVEFFTTHLMAGQ